MVIVPLSGDSPNCSLRLPQEILVSGVWAGKARSTGSEQGLSLERDLQVWLSGTFTHLDPGC